MNYTGIIIEESLEDTAVLKIIKIVKTLVELVTEGHKTPWIRQWTMHTVEIPEGSADEIAQQLSQALDSEHTWYADFKNGTTHFIIFRNKVFKVDRSEASQYEAVVQYGLNLGIPPYQLDFSPDIKAWKHLSK